MSQYRKSKAAVAILISLLIQIPVLTNVYSTSLYGKVVRPPAKTTPERAINRYRGAESAVSQDKGEDCICNPGLFSVIYLTGDSLPEILPPDTIPVMSQKDKMFLPSVLAVSVGSTVGFPNLDPFFHNVFSYSKTKQFDLGRYPQGESADIIFDKPGIVKIFCEIHYSMRAYVHILETPYLATSDEKGNFTIKNVKPGTYTLNVWQENLSVISNSIKVNGDSTYIEIR